MNRFSTADKLNRSRPATVTNGPRTRTRSGSTDGGQQSYKDQLLSVILQQNSANTSSFAYPAPPSSLVSEQSEHPQFEQVIEEPPNGNMKSKDFGNGEGELDMLFGFFLMNGACIVFFLLFGVCVICNCAARKPKFAGNEQKEKKRKKPTVSRLVAAMAPPGFGQRAKANKAAAAAEQQQNSISGNIPMLHTNGGGGSRRGSTASIRLDQNGNGGGGCLPMAGTPLLSNHSPAQRSFKSLVTRAVAMAKMDTGGKQLAMDLEDATAREGVVESRPPTTAEQRRQSKEMAPFQGSGGNTPARRMSTFSTTIEEPTRRISKLSHCSANEHQQQQQLPKPSTASQQHQSGRQQRLAELDDEEVIFL